MNYPPYINRDYKHRAGRFRPSVSLPGRRGHTKYLFLLSIAVITSALYLFSQASLSHTAPKISVQKAVELGPAKRISLDLPSPSRPIELKAGDTSADNQKSAMPVPPLHVKVRKGDTLSGIFERHGLTKRQLYALLADKKIKRHFKGLKPGHRLVFHRDQAGKLLRLSHQPTDLETFDLIPESGGYRWDHQVVELEARTRITSGSIESSLFQSGQKAGLSDQLIMEMVGILAWDIDFALDIRKGDSFSVVYEELFRDGEKVSDGNILAVEFINQGRNHRALRYENPKGHIAYYSPEGRAMRKAFLRTPIELARISSHFNLKRKHPILNRIRAHKGVDYAARRGTPIKATSNGRISFRGKKGGYGKTVVLKHGGKYTTLYAHLSRFARGQKRGTKVRQGQVIGYVGSTGQATGPHLHYEFRVNGVHRNPVRVKLPKAPPIAKKFRSDFKSKIAPMLTQLDLFQRTRVALAQD